MKIAIYTDGACRVHTTKTGGWAFVVVENGNICYYISGTVENTTNNEMELYAIYKALQYVADRQKNASFEIFSDSTWAVGIATKAYNCKKLHLIALAGEVSDLYFSIKETTSTKLTIQYIKKKDGNQFNTIADLLAKAATGEAND